MGFLDVGPGWAVMMALLFYVNPMDCFLPFCIAAAAHELGHAAALLSLGVPIRRLRLRLSGAVMETDAMGCREELICSLAGPAANLLLLTLRRLWPRLAVISLLLALFNLLPFPPMDGGCALRSALSMRWNAGTVRRIMRWVSAACGAVLAGISLWVGAALHGGLWPILTAALVLLRIGLDLIPTKEADYDHTDGAHPAKGAKARPVRGR